MTQGQYFAAIAAGVLALTTAVRPAATQQQAAVRVPTSVLERYVGDYDQNGTTVRILLSGDTLFREVPGQRVVLVPISETVFRMGPVFTTEFVSDRTGGVTQVVSDGVTVEYRLPRKGSRTATPPAPPVAAVRVPRSVLERYVGTYEYIPGQMKRTDLRVAVRLRGDTLTRSVGGEDIVLTPISETRFKVGSTSLVTDFVVDEAGVTQVMGSGFQQLLARLTPKPQPGGPPSPTAIAQQQAQADANNCGFVKVEVLPGNIGYLEFNGFARPSLCAPTASAAMNFLAATRARIVDLRDNTGGSPGMVAYISSFLISRKTHLNSFWNRNTAQTSEFWILENATS